MRELSLAGKHIEQLTREMVSLGSSFCFRATVSGSCMVPFIRHGDELTIAAADPADLRVGDVIVFSSVAKRITAHRLVSKKVDSGRIHLQTRGDATFCCKENVHVKHLLGRVVTVQRKGRQIHLDHPWHRIMALAWIRGAPVTTWTFLLAKKVYHLGGRQPSRKERL